MSPFPASHDEPDLVALATLLELAREIHGEVVQISDDTWAIHGHIPYDGDVIVAEFHERTVADELLRLLPSEPTFALAADPPRSRPAAVDPVSTTIDLTDTGAFAPSDWDPLRGNPLPKRSRHLPSDLIGASQHATAESPVEIDLTESVVIDLTDWQMMRGNPLPKREHRAPITHGPVVR